MSKSKKKKTAAKRKKIEKKNFSTKSQVLQLGFDAPPTINPEIPDSVMESDAHFCPYDENLLDRSRTQWQFGDWQSLAEIEQVTLQHHPDRAKLALLAAAGHLQLGNTSAGREFAGLAMDWGCSKKLISQILVSGVYNSLGCVTALCGQKQRAMGHIETAVAMGTPGGKVRLLAQERLQELKKRQELIGIIELKKLLKPESAEKGEIHLSGSQLLFKNELAASLEEEKEQRRLLEHFKAESKKFEKRAMERQEQVNELAERNRKLSRDNSRLNERQELLEKELTKAEAQINTINDLLLGT
jgi:hypothetical protein